MILQKYADLLLKIHFWNTVFPGFFEELKVDQHLFKIELLSNIINDFTVTFDQFNVLV